MLGSLRISACAALAAAPAVAQVGHGELVYGGLNPSVEAVWAEFEESCTNSVTDPLSFVTSHPATGFGGAELVVRSPDNQVVRLSNVTPSGVFRVIEMIGVPGELEIICDVNGSMEVSGGLPELAASIAETDSKIRAIMAERPGTVMVGGEIEHLDPFATRFASEHAQVELPTGRVFGIQTELAGERRFVYARVEAGAVSFVGVYAYRGAPAAAPAAKTESEIAEPAQASSDIMRNVLDICLSNYRTPDAVLPALEAAGMRMTAGMDASSFEFSGAGVFGVVSLQPELYCSVQSQEVPLDAAQAIGRDLAYSLFPDMVQPGAPEGGKGPCDGLSIFAPRRLIWLRYAQAGNSGECINDGTSAIIMN